MTTYYVDAVIGNDGYDGRSENYPWRTLSKVSNTTFSPGDTILFHRGQTWEGENNTGLTVSESGTSAARITLSAYGSGALPILNGDYSWQPFAFSGSYLTVEYLRFRHAENGISLGGSYNIVRYCEVDDVGFCVRISGSHHLVTGCTLHDTYMVVDDPGGDNDTGCNAFVLYPCADIELSYNYAYNHVGHSYDYGPQYRDGGFLELFASSSTDIDGVYVHHNWVENCLGVVEAGGNNYNEIRNVEISYNVFVDNHGRLLTANTGGTHPIVVSNWKVYNNTFVEHAFGDGTDFDACFWCSNDNCGGVEFFNNIIWKNYGYAETEGMNLHHNCWYGLSIYFSLDSNSFLDNPDLVNVGGEDYHLQSYSPCVDAGASHARTHDYDGNVIPVNGVYDMGAFEYGSSGGGGPQQIDAHVGTLRTFGGASGTPQPGLFRYYSELTIHATYVAGDEYDFAVLVSGTYDGTAGEPDLRTVGNGGHIQNTALGGASGSLTVPADLVFAADSAGNTVYDFEIEAYDPATGRIVAWVKVPLAAANQDTTFYMAYGAGSVTTSQENVADTWRSEFAAVYHLGEPSGTLHDSTSAGRDSTAQGITTYGATGQVGQAVDLVAASLDGVRLPAFSLAGTTGTVQLWAKAATLPGEGQQRGLVGKNWGQVGVFLEYNNFIIPRINGTNHWLGVGPLTTGVWYLITVTWDGTTVRVYVGDGTSSSSTGETGTWAADADPWALGAGDDSLDYQNWDGPLDEVRFLVNAKSANWITTSYNMMSAPNTFVTIDAEQENPTLPRQVSAALGTLRARGDSAHLLGATQVYYVDSVTGDDGDAGTSPETAWASIAKVNATTLAPGDRVLFHCDGAWDAELTLDDSGTAEAPIVIGRYGPFGRPSLKHTSTGNYERVIRVNGDYIIIRELFVHDTHEAAIAIYGSHCRVEGCLISGAGFGVAVWGTDCRITGNDISGLNAIVNDAETPGNDYGAVGVILYAARCEIDHNAFYTCKSTSYDYGMMGEAVELRGAGIDDVSIHHNRMWAGAGGVHVSQGSCANLQIFYNLFINNNGRALTLQTQNCTFVNLDVNNNTIQEDSTPDTILFWFGGTTGINEIAMRNNIIWKRSGQVSNYDGYNHYYNLYHLLDGATLGISLTSSELMGDPLFVAGEYTLQAGSPAIDAGVNLGYSTDYENYPVPVGAAPDMGAFEYTTDRRVEVSFVGQLAVTGAAANVVRSERITAHLVSLTVTTAYGLPSHPAFVAVLGVGTWAATVVRGVTIRGTVGVLVSSGSRGAIRSGQRLDAALAELGVTGEPAAPQADTLVAATLAALVAHGEPATLGHLTLVTAALAELVLWGARGVSTTDVYLLAATLDLRAAGQAAQVGGIAGIPAGHWVARLAGDPASVYQVGGTGISARRAELRTTGERAVVLAWTQMLPDVGAGVAPVILLEVTSRAEFVVVAAARAEYQVGVADV